MTLYIVFKILYPSEQFEGTAQFYITLAELNVNNNSRLTSSELGANASTVADVIVEGQTQEVIKTTYEGTEDFSRIFENPVSLGNATWAATDAADVILFNRTDVLNSYFTASAISASRLSTFHFLEGTLRISFVIQGNSFAQGRLVAYAIPNIRSQSTGKWANHQTLNNSRILPHVLIDPSQSQTYTLDLPLIGLGGMTDIGSTGIATKPYSWHLIIQVYNPLGSGNGLVTSVNVGVRVNLHNVRVRGKTVSHVLAYSMKKEASSNTFLSGVRRVTEFVRPIASNLPATATLFSGVDSALKLLGYSRPPVQDVSRPTLNCTGDSMTQVDGTSTCSVLGRSQVMASSIDPALMNGEVSDNQLSYLLSRAVRYTTFVVDQTAVSSALVGTVPVSPNLLNTVGGVVSNPSVAGILCNASTAWSGEIEFSFEFVCSAFHRGVMLLAYSPVGGVAPVYGSALTSLENITVNISGNTHVKWKIPWRQAVASVPSDDTNGYIYIYVVDSVKSAGGSDPIFIDVLVNCEKVSFHFPKCDPTLTYDVTTYSTDWIEAEEFALAGSPLFDNAVIVGGDPLTCVHDLTARANFIARANTTSRTLRVKNGVLPNGYTWFDVIAPWYFGWRGSLRYHVVSTANTRVLSSYHPLDKMKTATAAGPADVYRIPSFNGVSISNAAVTNGGDTIAPFSVVKANYILGQELYSDSNFVQFGKTVDGTLEVYRAAGDDMVFGFFLGVPTFKFTTPS